jgi:hypothetical protein
MAVPCSSSNRAIQGSIVVLDVLMVVGGIVLDVVDLMEHGQQYERAGAGKKPTLSRWQRMWLMFDRSWTDVLLSMSLVSYDLTTCSLLDVKEAFTSKSKHYEHKR